MTILMRVLKPALMLSLTSGAMLVAMSADAQTKAKKFEEPRKVEKVEEKRIDLPTQPILQERLKTVQPRTAVKMQSTKATKSGQSCSDPCPNGGSFDSANCHIFSPPSGSSAFVYDGNFYVTPPGGSGANCPSGSSFDTANCYIGPIPAGSEPFMYDNKHYLARSCDPDNWSPLTLNLIGVKLKVEKETGLNGRDDVGYVGLIHDRDSCTSETVILQETFTKIKKKHVNQWRTGLWSLVPSTLTLKPNQVVELLLYENDNCGSSCQRTFQVDGCTPMYYKARDSAYGSVTIPYADFGSSSNTGTVTKEYDLGDAVIRIEGFNW